MSAPNALVVEASTGDVAYAKAPNRRREIASATKLMTALLTLERTKPSTVYRAVRYRALPAESKINLRPGEKMTVADLMRGLLIESANDAAATLAERVAGSRAAFVKAMNVRAQQLGLKDTHYANPIGLDAPDNYSSARDLVRLTLRLRAFDFFRRTVAREQVTLRSGDRPRTLENRNGLVRLPQVNGVKTGHTQQAGYVLVGSGRQRGITLISVVLGAPSVAARESDTRRLLAWAFNRYQRVRAVPRARCSPASRSATAAGRARPDRRRQLAPLRRAQGAVAAPLRARRADRGRGPDPARQGAREGQDLPRREEDRHAAPGGLRRRPEGRDGGAHEGLVHAAADAHPRRAPGAGR